MRKDAREIVFKLTFEYLFVKERDDDLKEELENGFEYSLTAPDLEYINGEYNGILEHFDELKELIGKYSKGFSIDRVYKTDMALLLLGAYEIVYAKDIPVPVTVNEVLNLSKRFGTEKSNSFINGILASVIKEKDGDKAEAELIEIEKNEAETAEKANKTTDTEDKNDN